MASKVRLNPAGVKALLNDPGVRADLAKRADRVESAALANAEVNTGAYKASIHRESATTDRAVERVAAGTDHARVVEARTGNLARALNAGA